MTPDHKREPSGSAAGHLRLTDTFIRGCPAAEPLGSRSWLTVFYFAVARLARFSAICFSSAFCGSENFAVPSSISLSSIFC
jgi:hypothetical protein